MDKRNPNCSCSICDKQIYRRPSQILNGSVFCSKKCVGISQRINQKECPICNKIFIGRKNTCSRACSNKSRTGIKYDGSNSKNKSEISKKLKFELALERGGVCEKCGEKNYSILQIHHIVQRKDGGSDELDNLELLCPNCHYSHHFGYSEWNPTASVY